MYPDVENIRRADDEAALGLEVKTKAPNAAEVIAELEAPTALLERRAMTLGAGA